MQIQKPNKANQKMHSKTEKEITLETQEQTKQQANKETHWTSSGRLNYVTDTCNQLPLCALFVVFYDGCKSRGLYFPSKWRWHISGKGGGWRDTPEGDQYWRCYRLPLHSNSQGTPPPEERMTHQQHGRLQPASFPHPPLGHDPV